MLSLTYPSDARLAQMFESARSKPAFAIDDEAIESPPKGFSPQSRSAIVGSGEIDFEAGRSLLLDWHQFPTAWVRAISDGPTEQGEQVAVISRCFGVYVANVCRVESVVSHTSSDWSSIYIVYATVAGHDLEGAERFRISWNKTTDEVRYEIVSYSRPRSVLARLLWSYIQGLQRRFLADSCDAVRQFVDKRRPAFQKSALPID